MISAASMSQGRKRGRPRKIQSLNAALTSQINATCQRQGSRSKIIEETVPDTLSLTNLAGTSETVQITEKIPVTLSMENSSLPLDNVEPDVHVNAVAIFDNGHEKVTDNTADITVHNRRPRGRPRKFPHLSAGTHSSACVPVALNSTPPANVKPSDNVNISEVINNGVEKFFSSELVTKVLNDNDVCKYQGQPREMLKITEQIMPVDVVSSLNVQNGTPETAKDVQITATIPVSKSVENSQPSVDNIPDSSTVRRPRGRPRKFPQLSPGTHSPSDTPVVEMTQASTDSHGPVARRPRGRPRKLAVPYPTKLIDGSLANKSCTSIMVSTPVSDAEKFMLSPDGVTIQLLSDGKIRRTLGRPRKSPRPIDNIVQQSDYGATDLGDSCADSLRSTLWATGIATDSNNDRLMDIGELLIKEEISDKLDVSVEELKPTQVSAVAAACDQQQREMDCAVNVDSLNDDLVYIYRNPDWHPPAGVGDELGDSLSPRRTTTKMPNRCLEDDIVVTTLPARDDRPPAGRPRGRPRKMPQLQLQPKANHWRPRGRPRKNFTPLDKTLLRNNDSIDTAANNNNEQLVSIINVKQEYEEPSTQVTNIVAKVQPTKNNNRIVSTLDGSSQPCDMWCSETNGTIRITQVQTIDYEVFALI